MSDFARRMFTYNYRIFDQYEHEVVSLAVLADERPSERLRVRAMGLPHAAGFSTNSPLGRTNGADARAPHTVPYYIENPADEVIKTKQMCLYR